MKQNNTAVAAACLLAVGMAGMLPAAAQAQAATEEWKFEATIYGWMPAIDAGVSFPTSIGNIDVSKSYSPHAVINAIKFAAFTSLEAKKGKVGFWTDLFYADFGGLKGGLRQFDGGRLPIPPDVTSNLTMDLKTLIWTVSGTYALAATPEYTIDVLGGARLLDMTSTLDYEFSTSVAGHPLSGRSGTSEVSENFWDAVVGLKGRANVGADGKWFIPYYVDVGTGQSQLTWQVSAGVGYRFGWGSVVATWRYLDYNFKSDSKLQSMTINGPTIGVAFQF
jgi:hypothetical protein